MVFLIVFPSFILKKLHFSSVSTHFSSYSHTPFIYFAHFSCMMAVAFPDYRRTCDYSFPYVVY